VWRRAWSFPVATAPFPLHVTYASPLESQLHYALRVLRNGQNDVDLITLTLGANDVFVCQGTTPDACASPSELQSVAKHIHADLDTILSALRTQGRYDGRIAVVDYYSPDYTDPLTQVVRLIDDAIDSAAADHHALVASGFRAFRAIALARGGGDSRAAGLVRPAPDLHPTPLGQDVLEDAVQHSLSRLHHDD
jgi:lysophospholipase L1-like esterase